MKTRGSGQSLSMTLACPDSLRCSQARRRRMRRAALPERHVPRRDVAIDACGYWQWTGAGPSDATDPHGRRAPRAGRLDGATAAERRAHSLLIQCDVAHGATAGDYIHRARYLTHHTITNPRGTEQNNDGISRHPVDLGHGWFPRQPTYPLANLRLYINSRCRCCMAQRAAGCPSGAGGLSPVVRRGGAMPRCRP
jgi:hypothetical protein